MRWESNSTERAQSIELVWVKVKSSTRNFRLRVTARSVLRGGAGSAATCFIVDSSPSKIHYHPLLFQNDWYVSKSASKQTEEKRWLCFENYKHFKRHFVSLSGKEQSRKMTWWVLVYRLALWPWASPFPFSTYLNQINDMDSSVFPFKPSIDRSCWPVEILSFPLWCPSRLCVFFQEDSITSWRCIVCLQGLAKLPQMSYLALTFWNWITN